jgi:2-dehydro-3-deoxyphosphogluconate aldolase/(4S)-4-hydroxy-2-oxoglutarate aldolase
LTPTEVISAWQAGADFVKIFPCGDFGGAKYLKSLKAPFPDVQMMPTGGVSLATAAQFIEAGAAAIGVGSDLVDAKALRSDNLNVITENARKFAAIVREARSGKEKE